MTDATERPGKLHGSHFRLEIDTFAADKRDRQQSSQMSGGGS